MKVEVAKMKSSLAVDKTGTVSGGFIHKNINRKYFYFVINKKFFWALYVS